MIFEARVKVWNTTRDIVWTDGVLSGDGQVIDVLNAMAVDLSRWPGRPTFPDHKPSEYPSDPVAVLDLLRMLCEKVEVTRWKIPDVAETDEVGVY